MSWVVITLAVVAACGSGEATEASEVAVPETWWERPDPGQWWFKGGKDPKPAEVGRCEELAPAAPRSASPCWR